LPHGAVAHDPRERAQDLAHDQSDDAQDEHERRLRVLGHRGAPRLALPGGVLLAGVRLLLAGVGLLLAVRLLLTRVGLLLAGVRGLVGPRLVRLLARRVAGVGRRLVLAHGVIVPRGSASQASTPCSAADLSASGAWEARRERRARSASSSSLKFCAARSRAYWPARRVPKSSGSSAPKAIWTPEAIRSRTGTSSIVP